ncbi:MAG: Eco57I restriction-modification methylase domain-containing protein, partial [Halothece sp. Uz-M2-17]|nr:Eco57I restriction-modification methylase domain-containing protein [Halothece sp. Uz-M2-17]
FIFSEREQTAWHFVNVKYDPKQEKREVFRRLRVSQYEQLRTAVERLSLLDVDDIGSESPLAIQTRHDEAFDVEKVTEKFFDKYREVFEAVETLIEPTLADKEQRRIFTQKLFNRLMFIAFIQKKGWLTFQGNSDYLNALWEDYQNNTEQTNIYENRLKPLFFFGLNNPQQNDIAGINNGGYWGDIIGTVPYLNGGLFEQDEADKNSAIVVPDEAIEKIIEDLFSRFNFTVTESTPLDVEVAVDPEMLGKVFEELVTGRHESGSYYTPKPIVSFMCREALKGYLNSQLKDESETVIAKFVDERHPENLRDPEAVLAALKRVKVCDPACGSGAYLLGMLQELLELRNCLFNVRKVDEKTTYKRKLEIIENNIYGVDIDQFAVNIARLRLWLSLAVEYEGDDPPPLPNLKFKIETGDSLLAPNPQGSAAFRDELIKQYQKAKAKYLQAHKGGEKQQLEAEINQYREQISLITHGSSDVSGFDWAVEFAEVIAEGGFDIQVANPPYVRMELFKEIKPTLKKNFSEVHSSRSDLYCYFYARSLQLLREGGMLAFISSNKWFRANYGEKLREHVAETCQVSSITDFRDLPIFENASAYPMIFIAQKGIKKKHQSIRYTEVQSLDYPYPDVLNLIKQTGEALPNKALDGKNWMLADSEIVKRIKRMEEVGTPLGEYVKGKIFYGVKTGYNPAFIINGAKREELIAKNPECAEIIKPLVVGKDIKKWSVDYKDQYLIYMYHGIDIEPFPAVIEHLQTYKERLENRATKQNWYELQQPQMRYSIFFDSEKIIFPDIAKKARFAIDVKYSYISDTSY